MITQAITTEVKEEIEYLESRHARRARRYQECVANGEFINAQQFAESAQLHELHLHFIKFASDVQYHEDIKKANLRTLLNESDPIRLAAAREQYDVVKKFNG